MAATHRPRPSRDVHRNGAMSSDEEAARSQSRSLNARGRRGEMRFFLQRVAGGLYVEREDIPCIGPHTLQSLQFMASDGFHQWCDNDPVRFEHPLLHIDLKRQGDELWGIDEPAGEPPGQ